MKKIAWVLALAMALSLLAGCGGGTKAPPAAQTPAAQTGAEQAPAPAAPVTPAAQQEPAAPAVPEHRDEAFAGYLDVLAVYREDILGYDWQTGWVFNEDLYEFLPAGELSPVAITDVWGDETPELLFLAANTYDGSRYSTTLHVYGWRDGGVRELASLSGLDSEVGGGGDFRLFHDVDKSLWVYNIYYSEGINEEYTHFSGEGGMESLGTWSHNDWLMPEEGAETAQHLHEWFRGNVPSTEEKFNAAVPAEAVRESGLILRSTEYSEDAAATQDLSTGKESMSYDAAVAYLRETAGITPDRSVNEAPFFAALPDFTFCSGAGGWSTELSIAPDGTFTGNFHDSDMGTTGPGYSYGTVYVCTFTGRFGNVKRVDDYTYSMEVLSLKQDPMEDETIVDEVRYVSSYPYGLENAKEILVYLPGSYLRALPYEFVSWVSMPNAWAPDERPVLLPFYGLYNVEDEEGFFGGDTSEVYAAWAEDLLPALGDHDEFVLQAQEPQAQIVFAARETVTDFKLLSLSLDSISDDGAAKFGVKEAYRQDALTPERPLKVTLSFIGTIPSSGVSYTAPDGTVKRFTINISGFDGSLVLEEF